MDVVVDAAEADIEGLNPISANSVAMDKTRAAILRAISNFILGSTFLSCYAVDIYRA